MYIKLRRSLGYSWIYLRKVERKRKFLGTRSEGDDFYFYSICLFLVTCPFLLTKLLTFDNTSLLKLKSSPITFWVILSWSYKKSYLLVKYYYSIFIVYTFILLHVLSKEQSYSPFPGLRVHGVTVQKGILECIQWSKGTPIWKRKCIFSLLTLFHFRELIDPKENIKDFFLSGFGYPFLLLTRTIYLLELSIFGLHK